MLTTEQTGQMSDGNGNAGARIKLSYSSQHKGKGSERTIFYKHVFYQFHQGKMSNIWSIVAWPEGLPLGQDGGEIKSPGLD